MRTYILYNKYTIIIVQVDDANKPVTQEKKQQSEQQRKTTNPKIWSTI